MSDVKVNLTIGVRNRDQLREVSQALAQLRQNAGSGGGAVTKELESIGGGVGKLKGTLGGLKGALGAVVGGAGLGRYGALAGLGGGAAMLAAGAGLVAQGVRMAMQFERAATRTASQLSIGADSLTASVSAIKEASRKGPQFGYSSIAMAQMIGAYGSASGATGAQAARAAPWVAQYSRAYGLDLNATGGAAGGLTQFAGQDTRKNLSEVFGAAAISGNSGRRIEEFIGTATQLIQAIQTQNPGTTTTLDETLRLQAGVARAGGIFNTAQGQIMGVSALAGVTQGMMGDPMRLSMARRAGMSMEDIFFGSMGKDAGNTKRILGTFESSFGTAPKKGHGFNSQLALALSGTFGQEQGAQLYALLRDVGGSKNITAHNLPSGETAMTKQLGDAMKLPINQIDKAFATLETKLTDLADNALPDVAKAVTLLAGIINTDLIAKIQAMVDGQAMLASVMSFGGLAAAAGGAGGVLGMLGKMGGGGANFIKRIFGPASKAGMPEDAAAAWRAALTTAEGGGGLSGLMGAGLTAGTAAALMVALNGGVGGALFANATGRGPGSLDNATEMQQYYGYNESTMHSASDLRRRIQPLVGKTIMGREVGGAPSLGIASYIEAAAKRYKIDPDFVAAVMSQESDFDPSIVNKSSGATGLGQFMPNTAKGYGMTNSKDPVQNADATAHYLSDLLSGSKGNMRKALSHYYGTDDKSYYGRILKIYGMLHGSSTAAANAQGLRRTNATTVHPDTIDMKPGSPTFGQPTVHGGTGKVQAGGQSFDVKVTVVPSGPPVKTMPNNGPRTQSR